MHTDLDDQLIVGGVDACDRTAGSPTRVIFALWRAPLFLRSGMEEHTVIKSISNLIAQSKQLRQVLDLDHIKHGD
jgi:hypothetical protein